MSEATRQLASFVSGTRYSDLPGEVIIEAKRLILDTIGCIVGGYPTEIGRIAMGYVLKLGGNPQCTILPTGEKTNCVNAAYANGKMGNALDYDDTFLTGAHFGTPTVTTGLAACELHAKSGKELITSVAVGFEVAARIGKGFGPFVSVEKGKVVGIPKSHGLSGTMVFAATAASAKALGLDINGVVNAFGIAGGNCPVPTHLKWAGGLALPLFKYADSGWCSQTGIAAGLLVEDGYTGFDNILDGEGAFWTMYGASKFHYDLALDGLGQKWNLPLTTYKLWPACRWPQYTLTLFEKLLQEHGLRPDEIDRIVVRTIPQALTPRFTTQEPASMVTAQFSFAHILAMMALGIPRGPQWYTAETIKDPVVNAFRHKVKVELEPQAIEMHKWIEDGLITRAPMTVEVTARGRTFASTTYYARGDSWMPEYRATDHELEAKFRELCSLPGVPLSSSPDKIEHAIGLINSLEAVGNVDELIAALSPDKN